MNRRGFLTGVASAALAPLMPAASQSAALSGTITGRMSHTGTVIYELTRTDVKRMIWSRAYGGGFAVTYEPDRGPVDAFLDIDFASIEQRVLARMKRRDLEGFDIYDPRKQEYDE